MQLVELFAGTGAFSYAFNSTSNGNINTIFANDLLESSEMIFNLNHNIRLTRKDLNDLCPDDIPVSDILTAGFPCQPFSIAGLRKGFDDERSNVFWKILSIIEKNKPKIVILENVKNLQTHDKGNTFKTIVTNLEALNYNVKYSVLNTCKITEIPQNRERIYIVCFLKNCSLDTPSAVPNEYNEFEFDFSLTQNKPITFFLETNVSEKYYYNEKSKIYDELKKNVKLPNTFYQYRRIYVRENKSNVCPTLTANMGSGGHNVPIILDNNRIRKLTPRECFNLQGFPRDYKLPNISDSKLYSLAGNAVSIPVVNLIVQKIMSLKFPS